MNEKNISAIFGMNFLQQPKGGFTITGEYDPEKQIWSAVSPIGGYSRGYPRYTPTGDKPGNEKNPTKPYSPPPSPDLGHGPHKPKTSSVTANQTHTMSAPDNDADADTFYDR
jgi:hypothetical protein